MIIRGTNDNDWLETGGLNDTVLGYAGSDTMFLMSGDDVVDGGPGRDWIFAGAGADRISGGIGNDLIRGDAGHDSLSGNAGDDTIDGGPGEDTLAGGTGTDTLDGDSGRDWAVFEGRRSAYTITANEVDHSIRVQGTAGTTLLLHMEYLVFPLTDERKETLYAVSLQPVPDWWTTGSGTATGAGTTTGSGTSSGTSSAAAAIRALPDAAIRKAMTPITPLTALSEPFPREHEHTSVSFGPFGPLEP